MDISGRANYTKRRVVTMIEFCAHIPEALSKDVRKALNIDRGYKFRCIKCKRYLKTLNGIKAPTREARRESQQIQMEAK